MATEPQIYAIGTCAISILPNRLSSLTCQPITSLLCKTKPILSAVGGLQMNVNSILTKDYERNDIFAVPENKANSNPIKANLLDAQMNISSVLTKHYENARLRGREKMNTFLKNRIDKEAIYV